MELDEAIYCMEKEMGIHKGFFNSLEKEDDWSFIIKTHAFMEALLSRVLAEALGRAELLTVFSQVEMSNAKSGKLAFAESLSLLDKQQRKMLRMLSELRNLCAHDITYVDFNLIDHVKKMDKQQREGFFNAFNYFASREDLEQRHHIVDEIIQQSPKAAIWLSMMHFTGLMYWKRENARLETMNKLLRAEVEKLKETR